MIDSALSGALITASCGLATVVIAKLRCRFLVNNHSEEGLDCRFACGFTEIRLPQPDSKTFEVIPLQADALYIKKSD